MSPYLIIAKLMQPYLIRAINAVFQHEKVPHPWCRPIGMWWRMSSISPWPHSLFNTFPGTQFRSGHTRSRGQYWESASMGKQAHDLRTDKRVGLLLCYCSLLLCVLLALQPRDSECFHNYHIPGVQSTDRLFRNRSLCVCLHWSDMTLLAHSGSDGQLLNV